MKRFIYCLTFIAGTSTFAFSQVHNAHSGEHQHKAGEVHHDTAGHGQRPHADLAEIRTSMITHELSLSPDQTAKVKALFVQQEKDIEASRTSRINSADTASLKKNMQALYEKNQKDLKAILTQPQIAKLDTINGARKEKFLYNKDHYTGQHGQPGGAGHYKGKKK